MNFFVWPPLTLGAHWLSANSAYTLSPSIRGEGKFPLNFNMEFGFFPLPVLLRGEGVGRFGDKPNQTEGEGQQLARQHFV